MTLPYPIFIIGPQRSGTTVMANALIEVCGYKGNSEGHMWPLIDLISRTVDSYFDWISRQNLKEYYYDIDDIKNEITLSCCEKIKCSIDKAFSGDAWIEKTPGVNMINSVSLVSNIYKESKFIFMKRHPIDTVLSCMNYFPGIPFEVHCQNWRDSMFYWRKVRHEIEGRYVEVDQREISVNSKMISELVLGFLGITEKDKENMMENYFLSNRHHPTKISEDHKTMSLNEVPWTQEQKKYFLGTVSDEMKYFGYSAEGFLVDYQGDKTIRLPFPFFDSNTIMILNRNKYCYNLSENEFQVTANEDREKPCTLVYKDIKLFPKNALHLKAKCVEILAPPLNIVVRVFNKFDRAPVVCRSVPIFPNKVLNETIIWESVDQASSIEISIELQSNGYSSDYSSAIFSSLEIRKL